MIRLNVYTLLREIEIGDIDCEDRLRVVLEE